MSIDWTALLHYYSIGRWIIERIIWTKLGTKRSSSACSIYILSSIYYFIDCSAVIRTCNLFRHPFAFAYFIIFTSSYITYKMALLKFALFIVLGLSIHHGVEAREVATYGIETVDNVCAGVGELDQLADIASQLLSRRFSGMGSIRVSCCSKEQMKCFV